MQIFQYNLIVFVLIIISTFISSTFVAQMDSSVGSYFWFPLGAIALSYLIFDAKVFLGVWLGSVISGIIFLNNWEGLGGLQFGIIESALGALAPLVAIITMKKFNLSNFFSAQRIDFLHIFFLIIFSALLNSLFKFFLIFSSAEEQPNPVDFMSTYLVGDMIGGVIFIYIGIKVFARFFAKK